MNAAIGAVGPGVELCDGRYRLERVIGTGGMAAVWLGRDLRLERPVAVKVLSDTLASDPAYVQRFRREAQLAARLSHPSLVKVFDFEPKARPALVMEYVEGGTLDATANRPGTEVEVEALAAQLLGALEHIHAAGIVHRDVKPGNILVGDAGRALLTDFGIAQHQDATRITQTGNVMGTLAYLAPEVLAGERATPQSDLYSCGVVLRDHVGADSHPGLRQLVDRMTESDPGRRPASAKRALSYLAGSVPAAAGAGDRAAVRTEAMPVADGPDTEAIDPPEPQPEPRAPAPPVGAGREVAIRARHVAAALAALAAGIAAIAIATSGGGERSGDETTPQATEDSGAGTETETTAGAVLPPPAPDADPAQGAALEDDAYATLTNEGDPQAAIELYEQALAQFPLETRTPAAFDQYPDYAYSLYSYGDALLQAGRADEAVAVLKQRAKFPDQAETVQALLAEAKAAAG